MRVACFCVVARGTMRFDVKIQTDLILFTRNRPGAPPKCTQTSVHKQVYTKAFGAPTC